MKDKLDYTPLAVILARLLLDCIDAPESARNPATVDCSVLASWLATNKLMTDKEIQRIGLDKLNTEHDYLSLPRIMYELVFDSRFKQPRPSSRITRDLMCIGLFLDSNGAMSESDSKRFIEGLACKLTERANEHIDRSSKTAFDGDIVLKVEE